MLVGLFRDGHLAFPDGSHLIHHHGTGLFHTTIDKRFRSSLPVQSFTPTASSVPSTSELRHDPPPHMASTSTYSATEPDSTSFVFQCVPIAKNNARRKILTKRREERGQTHQRIKINPRRTLLEFACRV